MRALERLHLSDKTLHALGYFLLAFLPSLHERRRTLAMFLLAAALLGVGLEFAQTLSTTRLYERGDLVANAFGILCGIALGHLARRRLVGHASR